MEWRERHRLRSNELKSTSINKQSLATRAQITHLTGTGNYRKKGLQDQTLLTVTPNHSGARDSTDFSLQYP